MYIRKPFLDALEPGEATSENPKMNLQESLQDEALSDSWEMLLQGGESLLERQ